MRKRHRQTQEKEREIEREGGRERAEDRVLRSPAGGTRHFEGKEKVLYNILAISSLGVGDRVSEKEFLYAVHR